MGKDEIRLACRITFKPKHVMGGARSTLKQVIGL